MLRFRPQYLLHETSRVRSSVSLQMRAYVTKKPPDSSSVNYPLLNKLYEGLPRTVPSILILTRPL
jgi:hypothetical protein